MLLVVWYILLCKQSELNWKIYSESAEAWICVCVKTDINHDGLHCWNRFLPQAHRRRVNPLFFFCCWMRKCFLIQILYITNSRAAASLQVLNSTCNFPLFLLKECWLIWEYFHQLKTTKPFTVKLWGGFARKKDKEKTYIFKWMLSCCSDHWARAAVQSCFPAPGTAPHCAAVVWRHTPVFQVWPHSAAQLCRVTYLRLNLGSHSLSPFPFHRLSV